MHNVKSQCRMLLFQFLLTSRGDEIGVAGDLAHILYSSGDLEVSLVSPSGTPAVSDLPVRTGVSDKCDGVVGPLVAVSVGPDSVPVSSEVDVPEVHGNSERTRVQSGGHISISSRLVHTSDFEGHGIPVAGLSARSLPVLVSVLASRSKVLLVLDDPESLVVPSSTAAVASSGAVKDLLLRKERLLSCLDMSPSLQHTGGGESPATSASVLVLSGGVPVFVIGRTSLESLGSRCFWGRSFWGRSFRSWGSVISKSVVLLSFSLSQISEEGYSVFNSIIFVVSLSHGSYKLSEVLQPHPGFLSVSVVSALSVLEVLEQSLEDSGVLVGQIYHPFFGQSAGQDCEQDHHSLHLFVEIN